MKLMGVTNREICERLDLGLNPRTIRRLVQKAKERGLNIEKPVLLDKHLEDAPRSGRPTKQTPENIAEIEARVTRDRYGREKSLDQLASEIQLSPSTIRCILKQQGYRKTKPTRKPGLTPAMKKARLDFCLWLRDQPDSFWEKLIWTDETSVIIGQRRGGYRIWRKADERVVKSCIRRRWKKFTEFMFWSSFSYFEKGPCHIYRKETAAQRKKSLGVIEKLNKELEPLKRVEWELEAGMKRLGLRGRPGIKPQFRWEKKTGKLQRSNGGIDWYRYWSEILIPKLFPFAKRVGGVVVEDGAPSHSHYFVQLEYGKNSIEKVNWCGNSPDLNAIEAVWPDAKRITTRKGPPEAYRAAEKVWLTMWEDYPQTKLQRFVDRIKAHVSRVIECEGGNEYIEGLLTREKARKAQKSASIPAQLPEESDEEWFDCE